MLRHIIRPYFTLIARKLERASYNPREAQRFALQRIIRLCGKSEIGKRAGLEKIRGPEDAKSLPETTSEILKDDFAAAFALGPKARGYFNNTPLVAFAQTSGTTGLPKHIPLHKDYFASYKRANLLMTAAFFYANDEWAELGKGKRLVLSARAEIGKNQGIPIGFVSGIMAQYQARRIQKMTLPSANLAELEDWDRKLDAIIDEAKSEDIRFIAALPPMARSFTERALQRCHVESLSEIWPNLSAYGYGGVSLTAQAKNEILRKWRGNSPSANRSASGLYFLELYAATEGIFGFTFFQNWPGMIFNSSEVFFQFTDRAPGERGPYLQFHELEPGKKYAILVTTPNGLINYRMGDWIEILSTKPLTFRVSGRDNDELSLAGEKITPDHLSLAIDRFFVEQGRDLGEYVVWAEDVFPHKLIWGIANSGVSELQEAPAETETARTLDKALGDANSVYKEMLEKERSFQAAEVRYVPARYFQEYRLRNVGRGQFKGKRLFKSYSAFLEEYRPKGPLR